MEKQIFTLTKPKSAVEFERYYQFRWQQLRAPLNLPLGSEKDECELKAFHSMALATDNSIIGVGRIHLDAANIMRIRYMAVVETYQRQGVGSAIMQELLAYAAHNKFSKCWLNARSEATEFYKAQGFEVVGQAETDLTISHYRMEVSLTEHKFS